jgi:hypothetical protein
VQLVDIVVESSEVFACRRHRPDHFRSQTIRSTFEPIRDLWSISPTFYERICANILAPKKFKPKMQVQKKALQESLYEKGARKMLMRLTPGAYPIEV